MPEKALKLEIVTPKKIVYGGVVTSLRICKAFTPARTIKINNTVRAAMKIFRFMTLVVPICLLRIRQQILIRPAIKTKHELEAAILILTSLESRL